MTAFSNSDVWVLLPDPTFLTSGGCCSRIADIHTAKRICGYCRGLAHMPSAKARPKTAESPAGPPGDFPIAPPIEPMLAKLTDQLPTAGAFLFEPKWDGFRSIVFRSKDDVFIQSRDLRPLDRYFPELHDTLLEKLPAGCVLDGEIVIVTSGGLDFDTLQLRLHPAQSRVAKLAKETPSSFVAFDALAIDGRNVMSEPQEERR